MSAAALLWLSSQPPMSADAMNWLAHLPPDYISARNHDTDSLFAVTISLMVLEVGFVSLRYVSKLRARIPFDVDDLLMVFALVFSIALDTLILGKLYPSLSSSIV
ncbi:hypothetical protein K461DRAFT_278762 [Myriangium duriaei CBS 260.36]|uniref:Uncharacterized protein n=1 Tax=Myriangium duriaei CBS 260.36 TaxID=1168546 RepID=A0A9P4J501_9PEZI|nr:hypothetical protein K461DRAFT_278762 [Myriangium duriaei CBS 260.36]